MKMTANSRAGWIGIVKDDVLKVGAQTAFGAKACRISPIPRF
jgi:hypothetical protein